MAPTKVKAGKSKGNNKRSTKPDSSSSSSKNKSKSKSSSKVSKPAGKTKAKRSGRHGVRTHRDIKESELELPKLNAITPVGVQKPKGKKKGKVFVDDKESMMTILALVNAEKEGQIESKMMKERQLEEIRQARQREMEARAQEKKTKLEATKREVRQSKKRSGLGSDTPQETKERQVKGPSAKPKKRVSFG